jgi:DNA topoisomerase-1
MSVVAVPDLAYVSDAEPGLGRKRAGRHFRYVRPDGTPVRDRAAIERIRALAIPPAWTDVWICPSPSGHLQATGRDARGRKQYRYHADWSEFRDRVKFERLGDFGVALPRIRRTVAADLKRPALDCEKVLATVVRLLETTLVRVGNEEYARSNESYGLTTLRNGHVRQSAAGMRLVFKGKSGTRHEVKVEDRRVARILRRCQELPGQNLFEYQGDDGELHVVQSGDVNDYLRAAAGIDVTAKDFRTWTGTVLAASFLAALPPPESEREARHEVAEMARVVSDELRNTPAVCRKSYVHPLVVDEYEQGTLPERWDAASSTSPRGLDANERRLLGLLKKRGRRRTRGAQPKASTRSERAA